MYCICRFACIQMLCFIVCSVSSHSHTHLPQNELNTTATFLDENVHQYAADVLDFTKSCRCFDAHYTQVNCIHLKENYSELGFTLQHLQWLRDEYTSQRLSNVLRYFEQVLIVNVLCLLDIKQKPINLSFYLWTSDSDHKSSLKDHI